MTVTVHLKSNMNRGHCSCLNLLKMGSKIKSLWKLLNRQSRRELRMAVAAAGAAHAYELAVKLIKDCKLDACFVCGKWTPHVCRYEVKLISPEYDEGRLAGKLSLPTSYAKAYFVWRPPMYAWVCKNSCWEIFSEAYQNYLDTAKPK
jgi:hypothetical protein